MVTVTAFDTTGDLDRTEPELASVPVAVVVRLGVPAAVP